MSTLLLSAAEASGDVLGGSILTALQRAGFAGTITGVAGPAMRAATGFVELANIDELSGAGFVELLPRLPSILGVRRRLRSTIDRGRPKVVALIDGPDLHLPLLRRARSRGCRAVQVVSPQFWAWRPQRARFLARHVDRVLCLFPFEVELLAAQGATAEWVGHPVVERAAVAVAQAERGSRRRLVLLPGSRAHERDRHTAPFLLAAERATRGLDVEVVLSWPRGLAAPAGVSVSHEPGISLLAGANAALVAPGTATLEAAMVGCPQIIAGALHPMSALLARRLMGVRSVGLPNLLLEGTPVVEVLQDLDVARLAPPLAAAITEGAPAAAAIRDDLARVMGPAGFGARAAEAIAREWAA